MTSLVEPDLSNKGTHKAKVAGAATSGTLPEARWDHKFRVGDVIRTIGGSGSYARGEIAEIAEDDKYYRVDFGLGLPSLIREENLELRDEDDPLLDLPRSFVPPVVPRSPISTVVGTPASMSSRLTSWRKVQGGKR